MLGKRFLSIVSLLVIFSLTPLLLSAQVKSKRRNSAIGAGGARTYVKRNRTRRNRAIGAGGAGLYSRRSKPRRLINIEALPAKTRRNAPTRPMVNP
jgi:hypothetical protein